MKKIRVFQIGLLCLTLGLALSARPTRPSSIGLVAPYVGPMTSTYSNPARGVEMEESGTMTGLFFQWVNPERFQANTFIYYQPGDGYTQVLGGHLNGDVYPYRFSFGKLVTGIDFEMIDIEARQSLGAGTNIAVSNHVFHVMPRAGISIPIRMGIASLSFFPYVGLTYQKVDGDVNISAVTPRGTMNMTVPFSDDSTFGSLGLNVTLRVTRALEFKFKYLGGMRDNGSTDSYSVMVNGYVSRRVALSYRYKNMAYENNSTKYHLFGVALLM